MLKLNFSEVDEFSVFFGKSSATKTVLRVFIFIFTHTVMEVSKVRDHLFICAIKISQIVTVLLHGLPMRYTMYGAFKKTDSSLSKSRTSGLIIKYDYI